MKLKMQFSFEEIEELIKNNDYYVITDNKLQNRLGGISYQQSEYQLGEILAKLSYKKLQHSSAKWQELKPLLYSTTANGLTENLT